VKKALLHEAHGDRGDFCMDRRGARVAETTYDLPAFGDSRIRIEHTQVNASLRGNGIARQLLAAAVAWPGQTDTTITAACSYLTTRFATGRSIRAMLASCWV